MEENIKCSLCEKNRINKDDMRNFFSMRYHRLNGIEIDNVFLVDLCKSCYERIMNCVSSIYEENHDRKWEEGRKEL